ncbi:MAG: aldose epimerase family protein [Pseudomonadota bacterium]
MRSGEVQVFGKLPAGADVEAVEIGAAGVQARILTLGACVQSLQVQGADGCAEDVVLGHDNIAQYVEKPLYLGCTIGRFANRIAGGRFELDGQAYDLVKSDGPNTLHGGLRGFDKVLWRIEAVSADSVTLTYVSPDGDQGFPGTLTASATYAVTDTQELVATFEARTDKPTIVSMTNHCYFNLAGANSGKSILDHHLTIFADAFTPVDETAIPTGELRSVSGTPFDFREARRIGAHIDDADAQLRLGRGYDHNLAVHFERSASPRYAARLEHRESGRALDLFTTEPGLQFYSGNFLDGTLIGKGGTPYGFRSALCLEPQLFPNAPNEPRFASPRLDPGEIYRHVSIYKFSQS